MEEQAHRSCHSCQLLSIFQKRIRQRISNLFKNFLQLRYFRGMWTFEDAVEDQRFLIPSEGGNRVWARALLNADDVDTRSEQSSRLPYLPRDPPAVEPMVSPVGVEFYNVPIGVCEMFECSFTVNDKSLASHSNSASDR